MEKYVQLNSEEMKVEIDPNRGNILTHLIAYGKEWIYIDSKNYKSDERPRCGCPVLFPYMGALDNDELIIKNETYSTGLHGVVHTNKWNIIENSNYQATFRTTSDQRSLQKYPFQFTLETIFRLEKSTLYYETEIRNLSDENMPADIGFHPFFKINSLDKIQLYINDHLFVLDKERMNQIITNGLLVKNVSKIEVVENKRILTIRMIQNLPNIFLWSGKPDKFLVIEPWSSYRNAINEGSNYFNIAPNDSQKVLWSIECH